MKQLRKTKCTLASLKKSAKLIETISSPVLKEMVLSAINNKNRKPQGKRWTTKNKISALAIFKRSPKTYRYLQHIMPLPSVKTLQNILKKMPMEPGINKSVLNQLNLMADKCNAKDKYCSLLFDEIALKKRLVYNSATDKVEGYVDHGGKDGRNAELADHALVFLLQGMRKKFKQPLAFYFVKGTVSSQKLAVLIKEIIAEVKKTTFQPIATVCDQGPTNMGALKLLREWHNGGENYFEMDGHKIFNIYDVPHLFKSIRNNFMNHGTIQMEDKQGKWAHIQEVKEQNESFLYISKITSTHVQPKYRAKMRVKYAAQILSQTVAVVLKLLARAKENEHRSKELLDTGLIIEDLNRLFDFTNGPSGPNDVKKGLRENVSRKTEHIKVWAEYRKKLATLKFLTKNGTQAKNVKCVEGYITTLKSLRDIWEYLTKESDFKFLNLRQLNQDSLENLFGVIRQHSPTNRHPTCSSFMAALKTAVISGMTAPHSRSSNCEKDSQVLLTDFQELVFGKTVKENQLITPEENVARVEAQKIQEPEESEVWPVLSLPEDDIEFFEMESQLTELADQPIVYVSGYIASVLLKKQNCLSCKNCLSIEDPKDNPTYELIRLKEWWKESKCLTYPTVQLCNVVEKALEVFKKDVIPFMHNLNICQWTVTLFHANIDITWLCDDHKQELANNVFVKLSLLFIRRQCQIINLDLASKEEILADANKKGQQYGVAK